jgi:hypothetical protein
MDKNIKIFKNKNYTTSWTVWFKFYLDVMPFVLAFSLILCIFSKLPMMIFYVFLPLTYFILQLANLCLTFILNSPLIDCIWIENEFKQLIINYKYPFSQQKTITLSFDSFSFRVWHLRSFSTMITIKSQGFKLAIRDDIFGLDMLDWGKLKRELGKISRYPIH